MEPAHSNAMKHVKMPGVMKLWKQPLPLRSFKGNPNGHQNHGSLFHQCQHVNLFMIAKSPKWCKAWGLHSDDESISSRCQTPKRSGDFLKHIFWNLPLLSWLAVSCWSQKWLKEYFPIHIMTSWLMSEILIQHQTESLIEAFASMQANEEDLKACSFKWHLWCRRCFVWDESCRIYMNSLDWKWEEKKSTKAKTQISTQSIEGEQRWKRLESNKHKTTPLTSVWMPAGHCRK